MNKVIEKLQNDLVELVFKCNNESNEGASVFHNNMNYHKAEGYIECLKALGINIGIISSYDSGPNIHIVSFLSINGIHRVGTTNFIRKYIKMIVVGINEIPYDKYEDSSTRIRYLTCLEKLSMIKSWNIGLDFEGYETNKIRRVDTITYKGNILYSTKNGISEKFDSYFK